MARANDTSLNESRRGARARRTDCHMKALRASSVVVYAAPEGNVLVARSLSCKSEVAEKRKYDQLHFGGGGQWGLRWTGDRRCWLILVRNWCRRGLDYLSIQFGACSIVIE